MITAAALIAFQIAAVAPPKALIVRDQRQRTRIPIVASAEGPMVRPEALGTMLPIDVRRIGGSSYSLEIWGARLELEIGVPVVRVRDESIQLVSAPQLDKGKLLVPLQLISDVFPSTVPNTRWDADSAQLVVFSSMGAPIRAVANSRSTASESRASRSESSSSRSDDSRLPPVPAKHHRRTIIVDAGHGGVDNGMSGPLGPGPRIYEKNITLSVANRLGEQLAARGVDVVYTRTADTLIALDDRGKIANRAAGNLFISIHVNAASPTWKDPKGARGFETYFLSEARTEDARRVERMENESIRLEGDAPAVSSDDPLSFILSAMTQNEHLRESSELAEAIQQRLGKMHPGPSRGVKQAGFRVLVTAYMPAVLVEIGFGTNAAEAAYLSNTSKQDAIAAAIADAAMQYLEGYEGRVRAGAGASKSR
ncbi:MAG TPA: N-acetylmuramoyl-L-alanine amidase [Gemmatimonadaceae bacterium]